MLAVGAIRPVFTSEEVGQCRKIRIPELAVTPSQILLFAQCRDANGSSAVAGLRDDMVHAKVVSKASTDGGETWGQ